MLSQLLSHSQTVTQILQTTTYRRGVTVTVTRMKMCMRVLTHVSFKLTKFNTINGDHEMSFKPVLAPLKHTGYATCFQSSSPPCKYQF